MKRIFVSVPTKLLLLVVTALMLLSAGISLMSLSRLNQEFKQFQIDKLHRGEAQLALHNGVVRDKLSLWIESFSDVVQLKTQNDFKQLTQAIAQQYDSLQLNHNVDDLWLIASDNQLMFGSNVVSDTVRLSVDTVIQQQSPFYQITCQTSCQQIIAVPLLNSSGEFVVVVMAVSLVDVIYNIMQSLKSDIGIVSFANNAEAKVYQAQFISASNIPLMKSLFVEQHYNIEVATVKTHGLQVDVQNKSYLLNLMALAENSERQFSLALINDVTSIKEDYAQYRLQFLLSALLIFITLAFFVYFVASPFTNRILTLSNALPLLARKEFEKFRAIKLIRRRLFADELDIVANSATELSYELEQLNIEVEQKTKELENIAMYDLLTGLPNRNMLNYQLRKAIANIGRSEQGIAALFLDLDDFKKVNDSNGHGEGDKLLIESANRLRLSVGNLDVVCRFGGDEFVIILNHIASEQQVIEVADSILNRFKEPIKIDTSIFYVSTSIGIAYTDDQTIKADDLISFADIAMYEAKDSGGAQYHVYHQDMYHKVAQRVMLEGEVRQALARNQFSLSLQPQVSAKSKKLHGFEALLRWQHPDRGTISPDDFIPILENSEYMVELGYWVIRRCFEFCQQFKSKGLSDFVIAINLSAGQFVDGKLPNYLHSLLAEFDLPAKHFELELTEQTLVKDIDRAIAMMNELKAIGFSFAIDDFGTGYSSLAYLKKMPVDVIKIDKSFVFGMLENHADYQIIMSTIAMVKNLGLTVVAEGVESSAQLRSLTENNCDVIQGYYFSKPVPEFEIEEFIDNQLIEGYWKTRAQ